MVGTFLQENEECFVYEHLSVVCLYDFFTGYCRHRDTEGTISEAKSKYSRCVDYRVDVCDRCCRGGTSFSPVFVVEFFPGGKSCGNAFPFVYIFVRDGLL